MFTSRITIVIMSWQILLYRIKIVTMIGTLSECNPITFCCTALQTALSGLSRIVLCNCRDYDVAIIAECRINNWTVPERIQQRRFAFGKIWTQCGLNRQKTGINNFSRSCPFHSTPSRHRPDNTGHCYDFDSIEQNQSRHSHDCNSAEFPECYGTHLTVGSAWPTSPCHSRTAGLC